MSMIDSGFISDRVKASEHKWENREYLLNVIMKQLGITEKDLYNNPSWIRAKVREQVIDKVLEK